MFSFFFSNYDLIYIYREREREGGREVMLRPCDGDALYRPFLDLPVMLSGSEKLRRASVEFSRARD